MSLLKALHAATTLAAVKDLLATQVLTVEDLGTADVYDLSEAIRAKGAAVCVFTVDDVETRFNGIQQEAAAWLIDNARRIGDRLAERGNEVIDDLLIADGLYREESDEDDDEGVRTAYESRRGYWYVDEVQGGERYTIAKFLTEDEAKTICDRHAEPLNGLEGVDRDACWLLTDGDLTPVGAYDSYSEAHDASSVRAQPFAILPPLATRIAEARAARYTVNRKPAGYVFNDPDGNDDDSLTSPYAAEDAAWAAAWLDMQN